MIYSHKKIINNQEGAAMIEFAIILPLLLLLIFGIIEFSLFLYNKQVITNAAREGARRGVIMRAYRLDDAAAIAEDDKIRARVNEFAKSHLVTFGDDTFEAVDPEDVIITNGTSPPPRVLADLGFGTDLTVEVKYKYQFLFLSIDFLFFSGIGPIDIISVATMKME